ncbi:hypothetical protein ACIO3O_00535 [Streptomyces sp. NPDC087440]|uniref:hypothetical protein n=1 Tax=Streptomyces sp. NPDC087440 TaxID=3365790 RepID=UPI00381365C1
MAKEIRVQVDDETYNELVRLAAGDQVEPGQYAGRLLTADITRARFDDAFATFAQEHGAAFARHFGTTRRADGAAA